MVRIALIAAAAAIAVAVVVLLVTLFGVGNAPPDVPGPPEPAVIAT